MKKLLRTLLIILTITAETFAFTPALHAAQASPFQTEAQAQQHCPADTVVWVNTPTGVYHFKGQRWYANTKHGAFGCQKEADTTGYRATRNGQ